MNCFGFRVSNSDFRGGKLICLSASLIFKAYSARGKSPCNPRRWADVKRHHALPRLAFNLGGPDLIIILLIVLVLFGARAAGTRERDGPGGQGIPEGEGRVQRRNCTTPGPPRLRNRTFVRQMRPCRGSTTRRRRAKWRPKSGLRGTPERGKFGLALRRAKRPPVAASPVGGAQSSPRFSRTAHNSRSAHF